MNTLLEIIAGGVGRLATVCGLAAAMMSFPVVAQEADETQTADDEVIMEEIVVVGVRRSLELALTAKRNADSIMDGIAAEGIGKFPDLNLAESLQRITGVQIDTSGPNGERREGQIAVRGLPNKFSKTLVNGQTLATPNFFGGFAFGIFESDVVSAVNVLKSPTAKHDEGGLSGIVDVRTLRPLDINEPFTTLSIEAGYEGLSEDVVPNAAVAWGDQFQDGSIGVFMTLKWSDQSFRTDSARINGYDDEDTDGNGLADLFTPNEARYNARQNDGDRLSFSGGVEFQPSDNLSVGVLGIYSKYEIFNQFDQLRVQDPRSIMPSNLVEGGRFGDTYTQATFVDAEVDVESRVFDDEFNTYGVTADIEWSNEVWTATGIAHYSKAGYDRFAIQSRRNIRDRDGNGILVAIDTGAGDVNGFSIEALAGNWLDPAFYSYGSSVTSDSPVGEWRQRFLPSSGTDRNETEMAVQFDLVRHWDGAFISSIEGGLKYRGFDGSQRRPTWTARGMDFSGIDDLGVMVPSFSEDGAGFFGGTLGGIKYLVPHWKAVRDQLLATNTIDGPTFGGLPFRISNSRTFDTELQISSAYVMVRLDGADLATPLPIRGNIGARHVRTDRATRAYTRSNLLANGEHASSAEIDFSHTLPALNLIWDIRDDLMLRLAWYEALVRPDANEYRADSSVSVNWEDDEETIPEELNIALGNPNLLPFTADAWDISLEWYNRAGSGISLAYFSKDVTNGIEDRQLCPGNITDISSLNNFDFTGIISGGLSVVSGECQDAAGVAVFIGDSINNEDGFTIDGWEIGALQNFDFLDNWLSGFGLRANFTYIDTSEGPDFDASGNRLPLENVSKNTFNLIFYYERENWGARLAYNNRSEYFLESSDTFTGEDRFVGETDRLDFSASWSATDKLQVQAEVFNVTNERRIEYQGLRSRVRDLRYTGRIYTIGIRYRL